MTSRHDLLNQITAQQNMTDIVPVYPFSLEERNEDVEVTMIGDSGVLDIDLGRNHEAVVCIGNGMEISLSRKYDAFCFQCPTGKSFEIFDLESNEFVSKERGFIWEGAVGFFRLDNCSVKAAFAITVINDGVVLVDLSSEHFAGLDICGQFADPEFVKLPLISDDIGDLLLNVHRFVKLLEKNS